MTEPLASPTPPIVRVADAAELGTTRRTLALARHRGELTRPYRGVYADPAADLTHADLRAALVHCGPDAVAILGSAARVHGLAGLPVDWLPEIVMPRGLARRQRAGVRIHFWDLPADEVEVVDGIATTTLVRTLADVCRLLDPLTAVSLADSALDLELISEDQLVEAAGLTVRRLNGPAGRRNLARARVGAQSPGETRVRLLATTAGYPPDMLQVPVTEAGTGRLLGYADLGYALPAGGWLLVEFDGRSVHERPEALLADRARQNAFLAQPGISVARFAWEDTLRSGRIAATLAPMLGAAGWRPRQYRGPAVGPSPRRAR